MLTHLSQTKTDAAEHDAFRGLLKSGLEMPKCKGAEAR